MSDIHSAILHALHSDRSLAVQNVDQLIPVLVKLGATVSIVNQLAIEIIVAGKSAFDTILDKIKAAYKDIAVIWSPNSKRRFWAHSRPNKDIEIWDDTKLSLMSNNSFPSYFTVNEVANIYSFPAPTNVPYKIAIISLGGSFQKSDLITYWTKTLKIPVAQLPTVKVISVDGASYKFGEDPGADGENTLDLEIAGGLAPNALINFYSANNTDTSFYHAISQAIQDQNQVISISWGAAEENWNSNTLQAYNSLFKMAVEDYKINIFAAAGDDGSTDGTSDGKQHADFPASSPYVIACGGTHLKCGTRNYNDPTTQEISWGGINRDGATGGAISNFFGVPEYQKGIIPFKLTKPLVNRGVPDIAIVSDPQTGWLLLVNGRPQVFGGTSAAAPCYAGLCARANISHEWLLPLFYKHPTAFHDILQGTNGQYVAGKGYDLNTGLGSIKGELLLGLSKTK